MNLLQETFPEVDQDTLEYITSIATDSAMSKSEKSEIIVEHLASLGFEDDQVVSTFIEQEVEKARTEESLRRTQQAKNVGAYIDVLKSSRVAAPEVSSEVSDEDAHQDSLIKRQLLRQYDPDDVPVVEQSQTKGKKKNGAPPSKEESEDDEMIYGLGANENKLFKVRQREEMRAKAKAEQEEARALKVQQKLKQQGNEIKSRRK